MSGKKEPVLQRRMLTSMLSKKVPPFPSEEERMPFPLKNANIFSKIFFSWMNPILRKGYKRTLEPEDLFYLTEELKIDSYYERFSLLFKDDFNRRKEAHLEAKCKERGETFETSSVDEEDDLEDFTYPTKMLVVNLFKTFWLQYLFAVVCKVCSDLCGVLTPLLQKALINFVSRRAAGTENRINKGVGYAIGVALLVFVQGLLINHYFYHAMVTGSQVKAILTRLMLEKSYRQSDKSKHDFPTGKVNSIMGTDLSRIDFAVAFFPFMFTFPVPVAVAIALIIVNIGPTSLVGIGIFFICLFAMAATMKKLMKFRITANKYTDTRVNLVKELLKNFKMIKYYAWEGSYSKNIENARTKEMQTILKMQIMRNITTAVAVALPTLCSMISFLILHGVNSTRSVASIFSSLNLFQILSLQIIMIPMALASTTDAFIALKRVLAYVSSGDAKNVDSEADMSLVLEDMRKGDSVLRVIDGSFEWRNFEADSEEGESLSDEKYEESKHGDDMSDLEKTVFPGLNNINLDLKRGEFVVVTGVIGSGKSSLLYALAGFMHRAHGLVAADGDLLLCGASWIQNATVKDNILFGSPFDQKRYDDVIYACSLESDFDLLPAGDRTEVGERGITLSGGQKARMNLARAVYADKDIILLDDVLSAVDARVGKHIMDNCLMGIMKNKTRVLATHQLSLISSADRIVFLNGDGSIDVGTMEELQERSEGFTKLMDYGTVEKSEEEEEEENEEEEAKEQDLIRVQTLAKSMAEEHDTEYQRKDGDGHLIQVEDRAVNSIEFDVYKKYIKLGSGRLGWAFPPIVIMAAASAVFLQLFTNTWLSFWTEKKFAYSDGYYIGLYIMFTFLAVIFLTVEFSLVVFLTNGSSRRLNIYAIKRLMHVPMSFMDTTPMGRVLNRFTKDTEVLDNELPEQIRLVVHFTGMIVGVMILCVIYLPWFAIALPILVFMYISFASYYQASAREVKRIESLQRSFVYSNFNETLQGMEVIKAYNAEERFLKRNNDFIDKMNEAYYLTFANMRWLAIRVDTVAAIIALLISLLCVGRVFKISPASVGLLLSYVLNVAGMMAMLLNNTTQIENEMNSVERLEFYGFRVAQEAPYKITERTPPPSWPCGGHIEFKDVTMCYRPGLPPVLKNINLDIKPHEKIGICGRTGAGKSSIMTALYRLAEIEAGGQILIDDIDVSSLGLYDLRSRLSIIPQDPVLFRGSIRSNLDPFHESSDDELWNVLVTSGLIEESKLLQVKAQAHDDENLHKFHLMQNVEDDGTNFSLGERQLLALARSLVRNAKILILDEATSSVDYETDSKIQNTIASEFNNCTILCIAHRLRTIVNYDRILVLDKGMVAEFESPWKLYCDESSIFRQMCEKSGITAEDFERRE